jgi:hypothetical protein
VRLLKTTLKPTVYKALARVLRGPWLRIFRGCPYGQAFEKSHELLKARRTVDAARAGHLNRAFRARRLRESAAIVSQ